MPLKERLEGDGTAQPTQGQNIIYFRILSVLLFTGTAELEGENNLIKSP